MSGLLFENCPLGCSEPLQTTEIVTPDGPLRLCPACGQLISSCSKQVYYDSLEASNRPEGTAPSLKDMKRFQQRTRRILRLTETLTGRSARDMALLDVGCSSGALLHVARDEGFGAVSGVEPGSASAATASAAGFEVHRGFLEVNMLAAESYDVVTMIEVIEHLTNPLEVVRAAHRVLKPGGLLVTNTPNMDSWTLQWVKGDWECFDMYATDHGGHACFFSPKSMRTLAGRTGFEFEYIRTGGLRLAEKGRVSPLRYKLLKILRELLTLPARVMGKGHEMLVIFRKAS